MHVLNYHHSTLSFDARGEDDKFKYQCVNTLEAKWKRKNTGGGGGGEDDSGESGEEGGGSGEGSEDPDPDEQKIYKITYLPNNDLNNTFETETEAAQIDLPKVLFTPQPGQLLEGWKVADTSKTPPVATGDLIKPGTKYDLDGDIAFIAVWKDNKTFKLECEEDYSLMPPENTPEKLEQMIRENLKITYYEDAEEPKEGDTEKQRKTYILGTAIPPEELEIAMTDPKAIRKVGTFQAKVVYKGLYKRTLEKTVSVTVIDPNDSTFGTLEIKDINDLSPVTITYPDSIPFHGSKWTKIKSLVKVECEKAKIKLNKVENSELGKLNAGEKGKITELTVKVPAKDNNLKDKKADKLTKKLNKHIKQELPLYITIKPLIVMPEMFAGTNVKDGKLKSVSILLPDKTKVIIKSDDFTIDEEKQVVIFTGNYGGNLTFEELELSSTSAK